MRTPLIEGQRPAPAPSAPLCHPAPCLSPYLPPSYRDTAPGVPAWPSSLKLGRAPGSRDLLGVLIDGTLTPPLLSWTHTCQMAAAGSSLISPGRTDVGVEVKLMGEGDLWGHVVYDLYAVSLEGIVA